jgi:hypothetical protein
VARRHARRRARRIFKAIQELSGLGDDDDDEDDEAGK